MKDKYTTFISKPEISFWVPLISAATVIAMSWVNLSGRIDLLVQKVDTMNKLLENHIVSNDVLHTDIAKNYENLNLKVNRLETIEGIK